jgi:hypothetical protein
MPKIIKNYNNKVFNKEENNISKKISNDKNFYPIKNLKNINYIIAKNNKKENEAKYNNDSKLFANYCEKRKKFRTNSAKNVNIFFQHVERSMNNNNKVKKWHLPIKKENLINNNFIFSNKGNNGYKNWNKKIEKNIMDVKIILQKNDKDKNILKNKVNISSMTEQTQNNNNDYIPKINKKKFPVIS